MTVVPLSGLHPSLLMPESSMDSSFTQHSLGHDLFDGITLYLSKDVTPATIGYREILRRQIFHTLQGLNLETPLMEEILDLSRPPQLPSSFVSISHCPLATGFVLSLSPVGLDVEQISRIRRPVIERIAEASEIALFKEPEFIFPIKEACWKAMASELGITTVSQIKIKDWDSESWIFTCDFNSQSIPGAGIVKKIDDLLIAVFSKQTV